MSVLQRFKHFLIDPPPEYVFEVSEEGIAFIRPGSGGKIGWEPLEPDVLSVSPLHDNILRPEVFSAKVHAIAGTSSKNRPKKTVLILPDFCSRIAVIEFDAFPSDPAEQLSLVRFRVKKSVPFDVENAVVRYVAQEPAPGGPKKYDVLVVVAALEIIARYEAPFRAAGLHPGVVTPSLIATASVLPKKPGITVLVKLSGKVLSVGVLNGSTFKLVRCVEISQVTPEDIGAVLFPTLAYVEDELLAAPARVLLCGLPPEYAEMWRSEIPIEEYNAPLAHLPAFVKGAAA